MSESTEANEAYNRGWRDGYAVGLKSLPEPESAADILADFPETSGGMIPQAVHDDIRRALVDEIARQKRITELFDRVRPDANGDGVFPVSTR